MLEYIILFICCISSKENACILILCRNDDIKGISSSLHDFEDTFNKKYQYPYVFLNDVDFTDEFKTKIKEVISTPAEFGKLTREQWGPPPWIDLPKAEEKMKDMESRGVIYGGSLSYRNMCRFFSGYFYKHELVLKYDYYWRIEPDVNFYCEMNYDPFEFMRVKKKKYGFVITLLEFMETIPTLWKTTLEFLEKHRNMLHNNKILSFILDENKKFNGCHFWSNFEIASFEFFRSPIYEKYFEFLDQAGGFYYERWGDAPVHSIAASLFLEEGEVYFFEDIGYRHSLYRHCPTSPSRLPYCKCTPDDNVDNLNVSCLKDFRRETL
ncbi:hypothetical protein EDEG_03075 [Edhazardia aedis USNM 41457]|uniref:Uncharacterized protein n=1 Tax=Edhazardia aedis (strain USNM 41457) TaxID=1003232 RepID=J9D3Y2_EDHAE|nr:hypothetical protein EDEG_03075 [Edhazardia aedis USNM 41457]|eukprot:EJW02521.1 hypothetical protein EDEG_03075 [Edhazardia aedis USNM 41457]